MLCFLFIWQAYRQLSKRNGQLRLWIKLDLGRELAINQLSLAEENSKELQSQEVS